MPSRAGRRRRFPGLLRPRGRRGLIAIYLPGGPPRLTGAPDAAGTKPGPRPLPTCLFLRRSAPQPGGRDKSAAASRVRADRVRATLKEPRGGSREAGAAGVGKSLLPPKP